MDLTDIHQQLILEIQSGIAVVASGSPVFEIGENFELLSMHFQSLAICHLLEFADINSFRENLIRSGYCRKYFLQKSHELNSASDRHLALSRSESFMDSVAADDLLLAERIAKLSIIEWESNWEYEDDFSYFFFLHQLLLSKDNLSISFMQFILDKFENALQGQKSWRLEICRSLLERDGKNFDKNFSYLMNEINLLNAEKRGLLESYDFAFYPRSFISIEGLAILKFAEILNIQNEIEYPLCPKIGRLSMQAHDYVNIFDIIESGLKNII